MKNYVGVDIGGTKMYMFCNVNGEYIERKVSTGIDCTKERIKKEIDSFVNNLQFIPRGIGIAVPGLVHGHSKIEVSDVLPGLNGLTVDYFSEGRFQVKFINDVKAATKAEASNYPKEYTVAVIMVGTGIALGIHCDNKIFTGSKGFAGELGLSVISTENGVKTIDSLSSGAAILQNSKCSVHKFIEKLNNNDAEATVIIKKAGFYLGIALSNVIHLFNPDIIVVGGTTSTYKGYIEEAMETVSKYTLEEMYNSCKIVRPKDIKRIVALGAIEFMKN